MSIKEEKKEVNEELGNKLNIIASKAIIDMVIEYTI
jgi:hypothetical protein